MSSGILLSELKTPGGIIYIFCMSDPAMYIYKKNLVSLNHC